MQRRWWFKLLIFALAVGLLMLIAPSTYEHKLPGCRVNGAEIVSQETKEGGTLFLPSCADVTQLQLVSTSRQLWLRTESLARLVTVSEPVDLTEFFPDGPDENGVYLIYVAENAGAWERPMRIMQSANQAALFVQSTDPVYHGRSYVDSAPYNEKYAVTGNLLMLNEVGGVVYNGALRELRGRGNTSWDWSVKKPYQIKLDTKTDLLETDDPDNRERTWILLAEAFDSTLLHNTIALSLGQELEINATPEFRPVDLYYDGVYRGYYLLAEKVNVKPGRLDIFDTEAYLERIYPRLEVFPKAQGQSRYGKYQYTQGVEVALGSSAAYLIELDEYGYQVGESWFDAGENSHFEIRMPARVSEEDVLYVQQRVAEVIETVNAGGVHPQTGKTLEEQIDLESVARVSLIHQVVKTVDYGFTSTYFYIPENGGKLYAGPLWDFDIGFSIRDNRDHEFGVEDYLPATGWLSRFYELPQVQELVKKIWCEEMEPLLREVLLGGGESGVLQSLETYYARTEASRRMNYQLWKYGGGYNNINRKTLYQTYDENWQFMVDYLKGRLEWLNKDIALWSGWEIDTAALELSYVNADVENSTTIEPASDYQNYTITDVQWKVDKERGDVPWHALYTVEVLLQADDDVRFSDELTVSVNGCEAELISRSDYAAKLRFRFMGAVYEEAVCEDVDYGLLYHYEYFKEHYPEVVEEVGDDPELLLEEYVWYYFPEGYSAIETFDYEAYYANYEKLLESYFMGDVMAGMGFYLENDQEDWMLGMEEPVYPEGWYGQSGTSQ